MLGQQARRNRGMIMRAIVASLLALSVLAGVAGSANAADCKLKGWVDSGQGGRPIWDCPDEAR
jgi:hypothetical protein